MSKNCETHEDEEQKRDEIIKNLFKRTENKSNSIMDVFYKLKIKEFITNQINDQISNLKLEIESHHHYRYSVSFDFYKIEYGTRMILIAKPQCDDSIEFRLLHNSYQGEGALLSTYDKDEIVDYIYKLITN